MQRAALLAQLLCVAVFFALAPAGARAQAVTDLDRTAARCIGIEEENVANSPVQNEARWLADCQRGGRTADACRAAVAEQARALAASNERLAGFRTYLTGRGYGPGGAMAHAMPTIESTRQAGRSDGRDCQREYRTCERVCSGNATCIANCIGGASACQPVDRCAQPGLLPP